MSRQAYPEYKPSGIEWLGEIPAGWITVSVKRKYAIQLGKMLQNNPESDADVSVPYIKALHVNWGKVNTSDLPEMWANPAEIGQFGVKSGDLLVCEGGEAGRAGIVSTLPTPCIIQNALHRVRGKDADVRFLQYVLHAVGSGGWFEVLCNKATIAHFTREKLAELGIPLPLNINEQRVIAAFLDRETARIDALIVKKERQIELLQEKRAALISHAVTKGLDPNAKMKDSGIAWLGEVPEHWEIVRLGRKIMLQRGIDITKNEQNEGNVPVVSSGGVSSFHDKPFATGPGVIVGRKGTAGAVYYIAQDFWPHDTTLWVKEFRGNHPRYVFYKLASMDLASYDTGSANPTVNRNLLHPIPVSWPPGNEQQAIAAFLDRETARIDALTEQVAKSLDKLREYRTALISAVVTGKIDVREEVS